MNQRDPFPNVRNVDWYYAQNARQTGPISDSELNVLAERGMITPSTLVWREGMAEWQPLSTVRQSSQAATPPLIEQAQCTECQRAFSRDEVLRYQNVFVCASCKPSFFQKLREGVAIGSLAAMWRSGNLLVLRKEAALPDRCVKCNDPAHSFRLKRKLSWHTPWLYLLILPSLLIYVIVAVIVSKRARIDIGLCAEHRRRHGRDLVIAWLLFGLSLVLFACAFALSNGWYGLGGLVLLLTAGIYGAVRVPPVQAKRISDQFIWLKGVSPAYLAELPEFAGQP